MKVLQVIKKVLYPCIKYLMCRLERGKRLNLDCSSWGLKVNEKKHLVIGGCDCIELARKYGTPLHVVDKNLLQKNYNEFHESFNSHAIDFEIYYSYKTNPIPGILKVLHGSGAGAEVISPYELWLARKLKVGPDSIVYNGPMKSNEG
ncbi:pyridoxal-dependent decarboxylase, partial [bacterium]|nr:pyridoxal-dependent decarboxylase [bacterium]